MPTPAKRRPGSSLAEQRLGLSPVEQRPGSSLGDGAARSLAEQRPGLSPAEQGPDHSRAEQGPGHPPAEQRLGNSLSDAAARSLAGSGMSQLGFPVPPPPPDGTVPEPAAFGGVRFQRFPDPRTGGETTVLPDMRDVAKKPDSRPALPRPTRPTSPATGLSFAPATAGTPTTDRDRDPAESPISAGPARSDTSASGRPATSAAGRPAGSGSGRSGASPDGARSAVFPAEPGSARSAEAGFLRPGEAQPFRPAAAGSHPDAGLHHSSAPEAEDTETLGAGGVSEPGTGRRARRAAGHRAPEDENEVAEGQEEQLPDAASSSGRHTVPDELVQAATYRLPPDRVFRAKVRDSAAEEPNNRLVPKPRQS